MNTRIQRKGFTLLEVMIVVVIIGLLAVIAVPGFLNIRRFAQGKSIANNFRVFGGAFQAYNLENGSWPDSHSDEGSIPPEMEGYIQLDDWVNGSPVKGVHGFVNPDDGNSVSVVLIRADLDEELMVQIDSTLDDGDLATGMIRGDNQGMEYFLESDLL